MTERFGVEAMRGYQRLPLVKGFGKTQRIDNWWKLAATTLGWPPYHYYDYQSAAWDRMIG